MEDVTEQSQQTRPLADRDPAEITAFRNEQQAAYDALLDRGLKLDLTRGKPSAAQLDLSDALLSLPRGVKDPDGVDVRNYGGLEGIRSIRAMFAELLWVEPEQVVAGGNSSLVMMREVLTDLWLKGGVDSVRPWGAEEKVTFICPVPGYDRHFTLLDWFGIDTVTVPMNEDGPDAEAVAALVAKDPSIKGMWLVPTYANPTGSIVSQAVAARLASMETAAPDFKIFWDNAYAFHHLTEDEAKSADILTLASASGHPHRPIMFASTSKITFAGAGVAFLGGSVETVKWYIGHLGKGAIGPDKLNQLRHAEFFGSPQGVRDHMLKHREIIAPKFEAVERILSERLGGLDIAAWTQPTGGYFVSLDVMDGTDATATSGSPPPFRSSPR
jgi:DNA-binding transcriptional MocR family regulator